MTVFPAESVYVQVIVVDSVIGKVVVVVAIICPSQSSVAVGGVNDVISHWAVKSERNSVSNSGKSFKIITS